jgi:hypothetical protein
MMAMLTVTNSPLSEAFNAVGLSHNFNVLGISTHGIYADKFFIQLYNYLYDTCYVHHVK